MISNDRIRIKSWKTGRDFIEDVFAQKQLTGDNNPSFGTEDSVRSQRGWLEISDAQWDAFSNKLDIFKPENIVTFGNIDLLNQSLALSESLRDSVDLGGVTEKSRLVTTSLDIGIFDFNLAARGLYRPVEFYNEVSNEIVPNDYVQRFDEGFFIDIRKNTDNLLRRQQEGTNAVIQAGKENNVDVTLFEATPNLWVPQPNKVKTSSGKTIMVRFATTNRKNNIYRKQEGGHAKYVDIIISTGGNWTETTETMFVKNIPLIIAAQNLERAGIKVRIICVYVIQSKITDKIYCFSYTAKDYGVTTDFNDIAINTADPRIVRFANIKGIEIFPRAWDNDQRTKGSRASIPSMTSSLFKEFMQSYKNWAINESIAGRNDTKVTNRGLMMSGGLEPGMQMSSVNTETLLNEYYQIIDSAQLLLSKKKQSAVSRIVNRLKDQGKTTKEITLYFQELLKRAFFEVPKQSANDPYGNTPQEIQEAREASQQITDLLINALR